LGRFIIQDMNKDICGDGVCGETECIAGYGMKGCEKVCNIDCNICPGTGTNAGKCVSSCVGGTLNMKLRILPFGRP